MAQRTLIENIGCLLTLQGAMEKKGRHVQESDLGISEKFSMIYSGANIEWIGPHRKIPKNFFRKKMKTISGRDWTVLPGFVECHTHTVFAGSRSAEFEMRLSGASYQEIAARGGGILSTMKKTRELNEKKLTDLTQSRVNQFISQGVTTLEIKTGYALDLKNEIKCLKVIKNLKGPRVVSTYLGPHAVPPEFKNEKDYFDYILQKVLPEVAKKKLADRVDVFIEKGFFSVDLARTYIQKAKDLGLDSVIHADQLSLSGGSCLAVEMASLSADHVIQVQDQEIQKLASSETTAVLLPAADLYMRCAYPPARKMIDAGVRVALATDFNPGSCPTQDLSLVGLLARLEMKMTLPEVIAAYTVGSAWALNCAERLGHLAAGSSADFICTKKDWTDLFYSAGNQISELVVCDGKNIYASHAKI